MTAAKQQIEQGDNNTLGAMQPVETEVARGLRFAHLTLIAIHRQARETVLLIEALNQVLTAKGVTRAAEWADALEHLKPGPPDSPR